VRDQCLVEASETRGRRVHQCRQPIEIVRIDNRGAGHGCTTQLQIVGQHL